MTNQSTPTYTLMMDGCALYKNLTAKQALELYYHECMYHPRLTFYVKSEIDGEQVSLLQLEEVSEAPNQN
jgi:hypothetical protein